MREALTNEILSFFTTTPPSTGCFPMSVRLLDLQRYYVHLIESKNVCQGKGSVSESTEKKKDRRGLKYAKGKEIDKNLMQTKIYRKRRGRRDYIRRENRKGMKREMNVRKIKKHMNASI